MTIVAHSHSFVIGVDTHAKSHTYAVIDAACLAELFGSGCGSNR